MLEQSQKTLFLLVEGAITKSKDGRRKLHIKIRMDGDHAIIEKKVWLEEITIVERDEKKFFSETVFINQDNKKVILGTAEGDIHKREFHNLIDEDRKQGLFSLYKEQDIPRFFYLNEKLISK